MTAPFRMRVRAREVAVNVPGQDGLLAEIRSRLLGRTGFALATINLDHMVKLRDNAAFADAYAAHDFVVADGNPVVWLSRIAGSPVDLVPGSDLVAPLCDLAAEERAPVALFGSTQSALDAAAARLEEAHPGLEIVARIAPSRRFDPESREADEAIDALRASGARMTFIALGAPKQEVFAARAREALPQMGFASVGAGLDFVAGRQRRAPLWIRNASLEWLWRMGSNPRRLAMRYLRCAAILPRLALDAATSRPRKPAGS